MLSKVSWTKHILPFIAFSGCFFFIGFFNKYHLPKLKAWMLVEVERQSKKHSPVRVWPKSVELTFFPLGVEFHEVRILPQKKLARQLSPFTVGKVGASLSFLGFLQGELKVGTLRFYKANAAYVAKKTKASKGAKKKTGPPKINLSKIPFKWEMLSKVPVDEVQLENVNITAKIEDQGLLLQVKNLDLTTEIQSDALLFNLKADKLKAKKSDADPIVDGSIETEFLAGKDGLYISSLKAKRNNSFFIGAGAAHGNLLKGKFKKYNAKLRGHILLPELKNSR